MTQPTQQQPTAATPSMQKAKEIVEVSLSRFRPRYANTDEAEKEPVLVPIFADPAMRFQIENALRVYRDVFVETNYLATDSLIKNLTKLEALEVEIEHFEKIEAQTRHVFKPLQADRVLYLLQHGFGAYFGFVVANAFSLPRILQTVFSVGGIFLLPWMLKTLSKFFDILLTRIFTMSLLFVIEGGFSVVGVQTMTGRADTMAVVILVSMCISCFSLLSEYSIWKHNQLIAGGLKAYAESQNIRNECAKNLRLLREDHSKLRIEQEKLLKDAVNKLSQQQHNTDEIIDNLIKQHQVDIKKTKRTLFGFGTP
jgi:hypothetical protein